MIKSLTAGLAAVAGAVTWLCLTDRLTLPIIEESIPGEVLRNCGVWFAIPIIGCAVFGAVYALSIWCCLPDSRQIRSIAKEALQKTAPQDQSKASIDGGQKAADSEASNEGEATKQQAPTGSDAPHAPEDGVVQDGQEAWGEDDSGGHGDSASPGENAEESASTQRSAEEPGSREPDSESGLNPLLSWLETKQPWLAQRFRSVAPTLITQGAEAAREENRIAAECDESDMAVALTPSQICEWVLPLLGFIGTVWGLHKAIGPLSQGVEGMMEAIRPGGNPALREEAMGHFTQGFEGLRIAFDTTLLGLLGVVVVGFLLYLVRGRATRALGAVQWSTEEILRAFPEASYRGVLRQMTAVLQQGLLTEKDGKPESRLGALQETVRQGLAVVPGGRGGAAIPWFQHVIDNVRSNVVGALNVIVRLGTLQLLEDRKQTQLQAEYVAPDLRALRRHALPDEGIVDEILTSLRFEQIGEVEETLALQALAVANRSACIAIGGYNRNAGRRFLHEHRIDWLGRALKVDFRVIFTEQVQDLLPDDDSDEMLTREPTGDVLGLTYSPDSNHLYLLCIDGLVRRFSQQEMQEYGPLAGVFDHEPFVWFPGADRSPLVGMWRRRSGSHCYELAPLTDNAAGPLFAEPVREFLDSFERTRRQREVEVRVRTDGRWLCLAGRNEGQQRLVVCQRNGSPLWEEADRLLADGPITSFDVCERTGSVLFAKSGEGIFHWTVGENREPTCIVSVRGSRPVSHLFLNAEGSVLVAVMGAEVFAIALNDPQRPRTFDTYAGHVTHAAQSLDRDSIVVTTENNLLWLLSFRDPL